MLARIGVAVGWYDPENPRVWSGMPHAMVTQLRRLGLYAGHRDAFPWRPAARVVRGWLRARGRLDDGWALTAEAGALIRLTQVGKRLRTPRDVDAWVQLIGGFGRIVRGKYVTVCELSPSQTLDNDRWWASFGYPGATRRGMQRVAREQLASHQSAFRCCTASRWTADALVRDGVDARKIEVVGYGRNVDIPYCERDWSEPRFLFVGRDWKRKNGDAVMRAFARVHEKIPTARLDIVLPVFGDHPSFDVPGVTAHGPLWLSDPEQRKQAHELYGRATCFVLPSLVEPFGVVYVEAASAGLASIGTTVGGTTESIGDAGLLVDPGDDEALFDAMVHMADPDTARELGEVAHRRAALFTWETFGERVVRSLDLPQLESLELAQLL